MVPRPADNTDVVRSSSLQAFPTSFCKLLFLKTVKDSMIIGCFLDVIIVVVVINISSYLYWSSVLPPSLIPILESCSSLATGASCKNMQQINGNVVLKQTTSVTVQHKWANAMLLFENLAMEVLPVCVILTRSIG